MNRLIHAYASILLIVFFILPNTTFLSNCGEATEGETWETMNETKEPIKMVPATATASVAAGASVACNAIIQITFSRKASDGTITIAVSGAAGAVAWDAAGRVATWTPSAAMSAGAHTLSVTGKTADGQDIAPLTINFTATSPDNVPPEIVGASCEPKNGATGVDPAVVNKAGGIKTAFSEPCKSVKVSKTRPLQNGGKLIPDVRDSEQSLLTL